MSAFDTRAAAALADPILKTAVERTAGTAEATRALAVAAFPDFAAARTRAAAIKAVIFLPPRTFGEDPV